MLKAGKASPFALVLPFQKVYPYSTPMRQSILHTLRTYPWRHQALCLLPSVLLLCYLALTVGCGNEITLYFKEIRELSPATTRLLRFLTNWTNIGFYAGYTVLLVYAIFTRKTPLIKFVLIFTAVQIFVSAILVHVIKIVIGRPRPLLVLDGATYSPFSSQGAFHSFPSGHTTEISGAAFPLANWYGYTLTSLLLGLIVAIIGFSRIYLSMHHLSDIAGGLVAGVLAGLLNHHLCSREQL